MRKRTPMMDQYWRIKAEHPDAILLFHLGDFYEAFFDDAEILAKEMDVVLTKRNGNPMAGVPIRRGDTYINGLLKRGHKVAICQQVEDPRKATGLVRREVVRVVTPGTAIDESLLDAACNNYLAGVFPVASTGAFGLAFVDVSTGEFLCTETIDRAALASELARISPSELLLPEDADTASWPEIQTTITTLSRDRFDGSRPSSELGVPESALRAAGAVLSYVEDTQRMLMPHIRSLAAYVVSERMDLDAFTIASLELVRPLRDGGRRGTLLHVLDNTITPMGRRLLRRLLLAPSTDRQVIEARLDAVAALRDRSIVVQEIRGLAREIHDLERILGRLGGRRVTPLHLLQLQRTLEAIPRLEAALGDPWRECSEPPPPEIGRVLQTLRASELEAAAAPISGMLVDEPPHDVRDGGAIRDGFSLELDGLRAEIRQLRDAVASLEERERQATGIPSLKIGCNRVFGYYIEVTRPHLDKVPETYRRRQTLANAERFVVEELKTYDEQIASAEERACLLEAQLFDEALDALTESIPFLQRMADALAQLDVLVSLARVAADNGYVRPMFSDRHELHVRQGRHPVVEQVEEFVPNDLRLPEGKNLVVLTGPNMAGKSVYLRQAALICLMAQIGSFVPAAEATLPIVDRLFARVGASDALIEGISTFMMEMLEVAAILDRASSRSLIILDEMGRGTSTFDGVSIAWAVAEELTARVGAKTLFATHYQELTRLADERPSVLNLHVAVREVGKDVVFLHRVEPGVALGSYGVHVARLAGLPEHVTDAADRILGALSSEAPLSRLGHVTTLHESLPLFGGEDHPTLKAIRELDLDTLTPLAALELLDRFKRQLTPRRDA